MSYPVVIEESNIETKVGALLCSLSDNPDSIILTKNECKLLWDEFKTHCFRRDDVDGESTHKIFMSIEKVANSEDYK